ncbi:DUF2156 domain-containing protein [Sanguibacteroides justesenii]|uniref:Phosphatidylglycerol lysyltransferase C-terminal domain-containing protein n=1 Tax=Sanguibacteroides justesenii TaxID=1547597 RepID=A0A0C3N9J3_9PORP|nr:phosphatidylglycerol lysyltransferase domain-containing protein [Sanguibacteroides justesenii]KIO42702.1 hypothetical protein BA92_14205 [Sanguibacteroides justesenii]PXZ42756.1 DUF2156 domain-containing protein [Sanguibacteroides justesenii]
MIQFKPIKIEDKEVITSYLLPDNNRDCNLSFVNLCSWQFLTDSCFAIVDDCLVIRFTLDEERVVYLMPVGRGDIKAVIGLLKEQAKVEGHPLRIHGVFPRMEEWLNREFPGRFEYILDRDYFDYIYWRKDLAELKGKNFQAKRNHVNKFKRMYSYEYTPLTPDLVPHCLELEEKWCEEHDCDESESLENERKALNFALRHFEELELTGGALWVDGEIVAFTYGVPVTHDTFAVHIEKADTRIEGAYNMINQEFASHLPEQYIYLNREEDLGIPGLRKAKLSYRPVMLLEKGFAELVK